MNNPLISVIIPVYKVEKYLDRCISSVVNQSYRNLEIILVDDGSPDSCPQICDEWEKQDLRIKVIHKINEGLSSARNAGLEICNGEWICFVDSDDWVAVNMVEILLENCQKKDAPLSVCGRYDVNASNNSITLAKCPCQDKVMDASTAVSLMFMGKEFDCSACGKLYHRSLWQSIRFPFGKIYEDVAIMYKVVLLTEKIALVSKPLYYYLRHSESITASAFTESLLDYPNNTRAIVEDLRNNHPDLYEYACWVHTKAIKSVLERLAQSDIKYNEYLSAFKQLSNELTLYKPVWRYSTLFSRYDMILCYIFSRWYIVRPLMKFKRIYKNVIHR